jgi:hypothetical protein
MCHNLLCISSIYIAELGISLKHLRLILGTIAATTALAACGGGDSDVSSTLIDKQVTVSEGTQVAYSLSAGKYYATITSSNNGVIISWPGSSNCPTSSETTYYSASCVIQASGQLVINNPTLLGLGGSEIVHIKLDMD